MKVFCFFFLNDFAYFLNFNSNLLDDNLRIIRFQKALPNYDLVQNYYLNGVFIVERKTERHGNIEVEYVKKVRLLDSEVISNIEVIRARPI